MTEAGFETPLVTDLTPSLQVWQRRSVEVRQALRKTIIACSSREYFETAMALAQFESRATGDGFLGYALVVTRLAGHRCKLGKVVPS